jgi:hypothetical protein
LKGLVYLPNSKDRAQAIHELQTNQNISIRKLVLYSQWSRLEPRIAESLVYYISQHWEDDSPLLLNKEILLSSWPQAMGVLLEFSEIYLIPKSKHTSYQHWSALVMNNISADYAGQFFYGLRKFAGKLMFEDARHSLKAYTKWGYLGREKLVKSDSKLQVKDCRKSWSKEVRLSMLKDLAKTKRKFQISDYLNLLDHQISRRQAERDIASVKKIKASGVTRAREYRWV